MAKSYITLDTRIDSFKDEFNNLVNKVGDLASLTTSASGDSDLVQAINEHSAELGTITAGAMGTTASTVSTAIAELDTEADSDRTNLAANIKKLMLDDGVSKEITATANNSTNETVYPAFVDGATGAQGIETDTGLTYNPSTGLITATSLAAVTLDISGAVDIDGTLEVGAISGTSADFDAGVTIDNITIDGTEIDLSSGDLTIDVAGDINIDAGGAEINLKDDGTTVGHISMASSNLEIKSSVSDKDMIFKGNDGGSEITALTFDMSAAGAATFNDKIIATELDISGNVDIDGSLETDGLSINGTNVTSTATELNLLDGVSGLVQADFTKLAAVDATAAELNLIDGGATVGTTAIADGDGIIINDAGTMRVSTVQTLAAYLDDEITAMPNLVTTGALNSGSITSGFGSINVGSSAITTTGAISGGSVTVGGAALNETELEILDGATITTTELNILDGTDAGDASAAAITVVDADAFVMNDGGTMRQVNASYLKSYFGQVAGGTALSTIDIDGATDIGAAIVDADLFVIDDGAGGTNRKATGARLLTYTNAGLLTRAAQTNITSLGTLSALTVDNLGVNGNTITANTGALNLTPAAGSAIVLDGTINVDAGVVTGATSITSTNFVGNISGSSGSTTGNAATATILANTRAIGGVNFNGSAAINLPGVNTAGNQNTSGNAATATNLASSNNISITGDVTANAISFNGASGNTVALNTSLASNAVVTASITNANVTTAKIADDAITYAKLQNLGTADRVLGSTSTGLIGEVQVVADMIGSSAVTTAKIADDAVTYAKLQNASGNSVLVRDASGSGVISAQVVGDAALLIGNGNGFGAAVLSGDITMTNAGVTNIGADKVGSPELNTLRTLTIKDSDGSTVFTMYGAGA